MNSDLIPSSKSSNSPASNQPPTGEQAATGSETSPLAPTETASDENFSNRQHPIPPPSEPMQYRAIGLVRGRYNASAEQFTQGTLVACDGTELDAVLLGRIISLIRNHLDLEQEHFDKFLPHFNIAKKAGKPPSRKGTTWECAEEQRNTRVASMKEAAIKRGIEQRKATEKKLESICKELHESGLSIRKFIQEYNPPSSRAYLNKAYRKFKNGLKETAA